MEIFLVKIPPQKLCEALRAVRATALIKLGVGVTCHAYLLEIEGLFTQGSQPGRTVGESVDGILEMDSSDWTNGIQYHIIDTRPDTEFKPISGTDQSLKALM